MNYNYRNDNHSVSSYGLESPLETYDLEISMWRDNGMN